MTDEDGVSLIKIFGAYEADGGRLAYDDRIIYFELSSLKLTKEFTKRIKSVYSDVLLAFSMDNVKGDVIRTEVLRMDLESVNDTVKLNIFFSLQYPHYSFVNRNKLRIQIQKPKINKAKFINIYKTLVTGYLDLSLVIQQKAEKVIVPLTTSKYNEPLFELCLRSVSNHYSFPMKNPSNEDSPLRSYNILNNEDDGCANTNITTNTNVTTRRMSNSYELFMPNQINNRRTKLNRLYEKIIKKNGMESIVKLKYFFLNGKKYPNYLNEYNDNKKGNAPYSDTGASTDESMLKDLNECSLSEDSFVKDEYSEQEIYDDTANIKQSSPLFTPNNVNVNVKFDLSKRSKHSRLKSTGTDQFKEDDELLPKRSLTKTTSFDRDQIITNRPKASKSFNNSSLDDSIRLKAIKKTSVHYDLQSILVVDGNTINKRLNEIYNNLQYRDYAEQSLLVCIMNEGDFPTILSSLYKYKGLVLLKTADLLNEFIVEAFKFFTTDNKMILVNERIKVFTLMNNYSFSKFVSFLKNHQKSHEIYNVFKFVLIPSTDDVLICSKLAHLSSVYSQLVNPMFINMVSKKSEQNTYENEMDAEEVENLFQKISLCSFRSEEFMCSTAVLELVGDGGERSESVTTVPFVCSVIIKYKSVNDANSSFVLPSQNVFNLPSHFPFKSIDVVKKLLPYLVEKFLIKFKPEIYVLPKYQRKKITGNEYFIKSKLSNDIIIETDLQGGNNLLMSFIKLKEAGQVAGEQGVYGSNCMGLNRNVGLKQQINSTVVFTEKNKAIMTVFVDGIVYENVRSVRIVKGYRFQEEDKSRFSVRLCYPTKIKNC